MRTLLAATATVVVVALAGGCSSSGGAGGAADPQGTGTTGGATPTESGTPTPSPGSGAVVDSEACSEVRAGIDAFNAGGYDETVEHFKAAVPLAEQQDDGSVLASQLIEAVRYYADLEAGLYPEAARSSPDFAKYKAITLGQCVAADGGETSEPPGANI